MELFFQASFISLLRQTKISYVHVTKIPRDDGLLSEPTTEVNGNDPLCKRVPVGAMTTIYVKLDSNTN